MELYVNYYKGKYTLSSNIILRKSFLKCSIYNIYTDTSTDINFALYSILTYFVSNATNLTEISYFLSKKGIVVDFNKVQNLLNHRDDFINILVAKDVPYNISNPYINYNIINHYEYTPENIDLLITNKCNLQCPHCYRNSSSIDPIKNISIKRWYALIDEMEQLRVRSLKITGGEAFLVSELFEIIDYASKKRIHIAILTNGTIPLHNKWFNLLSRPNIILGVSLDGATSDTNDKIRGVNSFNKTCLNLLKFKEFNIKFSITFTVNVHNYNEIDSMVELAYKLGAKTLMFNFIEESGRALKNKQLYQNCGFDKNTIKQKIEIIKQSESRIRIVMVDNHGLVTNKEDLKMIDDKKNLIICKAGFGSFAIDSDLRVAPCIYGIGGKKEYIIDNLQHKSIQEVWNSSNFDLFRGGIKIDNLPKCRECVNKDVCNLKYCRLRPIYEGNNIYDTVSFCEYNLLT